MTESDVREIIRQEMRAFRATLWDTRTQNHDAQTAIDKLRDALDAHFPESPREYAERLDEDTIDRAESLGSWNLNDIGDGLVIARGEMKDGAYADALRARRRELLQEEK